MALADCEAIFRPQEPKKRMRDPAAHALPRAVPRSRSRGVAAPQGNAHRRALEAGAQHLRPAGIELDERGSAACVHERRRYMMIQMPVITAIKPERRSKGLDDLRCWHVAYRFCGLTAEIIVYAQDDAEARAKAVHQLRVRGLKVA